MIYLFLAGVLTMLGGGWMFSERWCFGLMVIAVGLVMVVASVALSEPHAPRTPKGPHGSKRT